MSEYPNWNPYQIFVWSKKEFQAWAKEVGGCALYDGTLWEPKYSEIAPETYKVRFVIQQPSYR